jgi:hypothetical protein
MEPKLTIDIQGEEVLVIYHDQEALDRSRHVLEGKTGHIMEAFGKVYATFHDPIPHYHCTVLNSELRRVTNEKKGE